MSARQRVIWEWKNQKLGDYKRWKMNVGQTDRDILFSNETFVIGMLQAVSGGALVAALAQSEALIKLSGNIALSFSPLWPWQS
jgi:hypothetical protein